MAEHSKIVGGSTADRVIACPGSVALVQRMPPQVENKYMAQGTMLHGCMEDLLAENGDMGDIIAKHKLDDDQADKLQFCLAALDEIDPDQKMTFVQETQVGFAGVPELDGVFGHADLIGRLGGRVIVLDWKFGDGVMVEAEESAQGLFYAAAAKRTLAWAFDGAAEVEIVIVQPPHTRRWVTTVSRVEEFERQLIAAVKTASRPAGDGRPLPLVPGQADLPAVQRGCGPRHAPGAGHAQSRGTGPGAGAGREAGRLHRRGAGARAAAA